MPRTIPSINVDRICDALIDTKTAHYWDIKRRRVIVGGDDEGENARTVLIDTVNARSLRKLFNDFAKILDSDDQKAVQEALKAGTDKVAKVIDKAPEIKKAWYKHAGADLVQRAVEWLEMQGIEEFSPSGALARYIGKKKKAARKRASEEE